MTHGVAGSVLHVVLTLLNLMLCGVPGILRSHFRVRAAFTISLYFENGFAQNVLTRSPSQQMECKLNCGTGVRFVVYEESTLDKLRLLQFIYFEPESAKQPNSRFRIYVH